MGLCWCCLGAASVSIPRRVLSVQPPKGVLMHLEIKGDVSTVEGIMQYMFDGGCSFAIDFRARCHSEVFFACFAQTWGCQSLVNRT